MESDLRRIGRLPAALIVLAAAGVAFLVLSAVGSDTQSPPGAQRADPRATVTAAKARREASPLRSHPTVVEPPAGGSVVSGKAQSAPATTQNRKQPQAQAASGSLRRAVGAKIMTAMAGPYPDAALLGRVRRGEVGGVILFGPNITGRLQAAVSALQAAARAGGNPELLIATDQEGGPIRRLSAAPPTAAPAQIATAAAAGQGLRTGRALQATGINVDLAPVADVAQPSSFLGSRSFGGDPARVAAAACQFASGLKAAGVAATFKHFPGLGRAAQNTDTATVTIAAPANALWGDLQAYRRCRPPLVMLSNAIYPAYDPDTPAVFSRKIVQHLLRGRLGFRGVTVSDTLSAPAVAGPTAAIRATAAGVDVLLYTDEHISERAYSNVLAAAKDGRLDREAIMASARRIRTLTAG